jgi:hypothetical protein
MVGNGPDPQLSVQGSPCSIAAEAKLIGPKPPVSSSSKILILQGSIHLQCNAVNDSASGPRARPKPMRARGQNETNKISLEP